MGNWIKKVGADWYLLDVKGAQVAKIKNGDATLTEGRVIRYGKQESVIVSTEDDRVEISPAVTVSDARYTTTKLRISEIQVSVTVEEVRAMTDGATREANAIIGKINSADFKLFAVANATVTFMKEDEFDKALMVYGQYEKRKSVNTMILTDKDGGSTTHIISKIS